MTKNSSKPTSRKTGAQKPEPGPRNKAAIREAIDRSLNRPVRAYVKIEEGAAGESIAGAPHADESGHNATLLDAFGTTSSEFLRWSMGELENATRRRSAERGQDESPFNAALALVQAIGPQDELEAALASQMAGCHALSMEMIGRAKSTDRTDHIELYGNMAVKLQRTFTAQLEALGRMRGKGQQTVRVEHVTVHSGAQAIVGDVHHHPRGASGGTAKSEEPPHASTPTTRSGASEALPGPDPAGYEMPVPGDAQRPVPDARRSVSRRPRQPKRIQARTLEPRND